MAWDAARPVPWKRLFTFVAIYSLVVLGIFALLKPGQMLQSIPGVVFGATVAVGIMAVLTKFGWHPTMLKSKAEVAEARAQRAAARDKPTASRSHERGRPPPMRRGPSPRPRSARAPARRTTPDAPATRASAERHGVCA